MVTDATLKVKHLKPTGANYNKTARYKQGEAFYTLGYGFWITAIASAKLAMMKKKPIPVSYTHLDVYKRQILRHDIIWFVQKENSFQSQFSVYSL